jgi:hypothetical protein
MEWMPDALREWMSEERIPSTFERGESSRATSMLPLLEEPTKHAGPTLVARNARHGLIIQILQDDLRALQDQTIETVDDPISHLEGRL